MSSKLRVKGTGGGTPPVKITDVTVSGGAVTILTSGAIALEVGKVYKFEANIKATVSSSNGGYSPHINGDAVAGNYNRAQITSGNSHYDGSGISGGQADSADSLIMEGTIRVFNDLVYVEYEYIQMRSAGNHRRANACYFHSSATSVTEFQMTASQSTTIDDTSRLVIWEA